MPNVLGISAFFHDSAAALLRDGELVAAAQEERFTRRKFDRRFPVEAMRYCLAAGGMSLADLDAVVFYEKPARKVERIVSDFLAVAPRGEPQFLSAAHELLDGKLDLDSELRERLAALDPRWPGPLLFTEHHQAHAASAFYPSPFESAAVLVVDAVGEWASTSLHVGRDTLTPLVEQRYPHSLGILYSAFTHYLGFRVNSGEYKVMGLAPYGEPRYVELILDHLLDLKDDGSFRLNLRYFDVLTGTAMTSPAFHELFGGDPAPRGTVPRQREMDIAASLQAVLEEIMLRTVRYGVESTGERNLCLAGGVALNCVANARIAQSGLVDNLWIQPAAGDSGGALGAALVAHHEFFGEPRVVPLHGDGMAGALLGPDIEDGADAALAEADATFETLEHQELLGRVVNDLVAGLVVGWCQGRLELGPRALGNRSLLGDPRDPEMQSRLNVKTKHRESFRPFAPAVTEEDAADWFDLSGVSPYMLLVADVLPERRRAIPAVTHVDGSARVQTVGRDTNLLLHRLIAAFGEETGCPVLVNTSFNVRGEPMVCDARDAFRCFMGTDVDVLVIGNRYLRKEEQGRARAEAHDVVYELD